MNSRAIISNTYTNTPELHPNLILGSMQLLAWFLFHPSAWRNYIARVDPNLSPEFALIELNRKQWNNRGLRRVILMGYVFWPLLVGLIVGLLVSIFHGSDDFLFGMLNSMAYVFAAGIAVGTTISVTGGITYGVVLGLASVTLFTPQGVASGLIYSGAASIASGVIINIVDSNSSRSSLGSQIRGITLAVLPAGLLLSIIYILVSNQALNTPDAELRLAVGILYSVIPGMLVWWRTNSWHYGVVVGVIAGLWGGVAYSIVRSTGTSGGLLFQIAGGMAGGIFFASLFALAYILAEYFAGSWAGAIAGTLVSGVAWIPLAPYIFVPSVHLWPTLPLGLIVILLGLTLTWWRPVVLYPLLIMWNQLLYFNDKRRTAAGQPSLLGFHSAFWDEFQWLRLVGLDNHLVLVAKRNPAEGQAALNYLALSRQRWAAQAVQIELLVHQLEQCTDIDSIQRAYQMLATDELENPASPILNSFSRYSQDVKAALGQTTDYNKRWALNEVRDRLNQLIRDLNLTTTPYAKRFYPLAHQWHQIIVDYSDELAKAVARSGIIDNPYIFSSPLTEKRGIFVGRSDIATRIEQLLQEPHCPSLFLYGQRRMGKTSLLKHLGQILPSTIIPLFVDGQRISLGRNYPDYLYSIAKEMAKSARDQRSVILPPLSRESLMGSPFLTFNDWLDEIEQILSEQDKRMALLLLDELEAIDRIDDKEGFEIEDLLSLLRSLVQHRPQFKVLLAASRPIEEFHHWASYLINMQTLKISYLDTEDALHLIEGPIENFALHYEPSASQRVLKLTRGHPHLVQLLCHEIVVFKNKQPVRNRYLVTLADVEAALSSALKVNDFFFAEIEQNQVDDAGLALLRLIAAQGEAGGTNYDTLAQQRLPNLDITLYQLLQRDLIEPQNGGYRFQVEMIRYWFEKNMHIQAL